MRKARAPNYDAPPLPTASEASGNDLPPSLPTDRKSFSDFYENLQKWSLDRKNLPYFRIPAKNFLLEKNPTSISKIGGILEKKIKIPIGSRHFFERKKNQNPHK